MKKKIALIFLAIIFIVFVAIQFIPYGRNHSNPPIIGEPNWDSAQTKELFSRSCADCHSNQTSWPWYSNIAPASWLVQKDVDEGRAKFNISELGRGGKNETDEAAEAVQEGEMPLTVYVIMHPSASLSSQEKADLIKGLSATFGTEASKGDYRQNEKANKQEHDDDD